MNSEIYFQLKKGHYLYLEQMLEEYGFGGPLFYICHDKEGKRYAVWCTDLDDERYIIVPVSSERIKEMLEGKITIEEFFLSANSFWDISCPGKSFEEDIVKRYPIQKFPVEKLPGELVYQIFDNSVRAYSESL